MAKLGIYTVHINPALPHPHEAAQFVLEGFSWKAFFFSAVWVLYQRLWWIALGIFLFSGAMLYLVDDHVIDYSGFLILHLGLHLLVGFHGTDWLRARLTRQGYLTADITSGDSLLRAEQRYFDRYFSAHPSLAVS